MSQFAFLRQEWAELFEASAKAERLVHADPRASCFYARRGLEIGVAWAYKYDTPLKLPYRFRAKARAFLRAHQDHIAIQKLRMNRALTRTDLSELERMLAESGGAT